MKTLKLAMLAMFVVSAGAAFAEAPQVSPQTIAKIHKAWQAAMEKGIAWKAEQPLGIQYVSVTLTQHRFPDAENYFALLPVGVVAPGAPKKDPNQATYFILKKTGGFAGKTEYSEPVPLESTEQADNAPFGDEGPELEIESLGGKKDYTRIQATTDSQIQYSFTSLDSMLAQ